jgi:hypothetical protein
MPSRSNVSRKRLGVEDLERLQPELQHPLGLFLVRRDLTHDLFAEALLSLEYRLLVGDEVILVFVNPEIRDGFVLRHGDRLQRKQ